MNINDKDQVLSNEYKSNVIPSKIVEHYLVT